MKIFYCLVSVVVVFFVFFPVWKQASYAPANTRYLFAGGYIPDYYQYLSWIQSGRMGTILLGTRYTNSIGPKALIHPLFSLSGYLSRPIPLSPAYTYLALRIAATLAFLASFFALIDSLIPSARGRVMATMFLLTSTGFYQTTITNSVPALLEPVSWSTNFNVIGKFTLPPHHLLALAALCLIIRLSHVSPLGPLQTILSTLLGIAMGFLNPSILLFCYLFLCAGTAIHATLHRSAIRPTAVFGVIVILGTIPVVLYSYSIFQTLPPWSIMYRLMKAFNPPSTWGAYLSALGPMLFLSPLALIRGKTLAKTPSLPMLFAWGYLPLLLFLAVGILPINYSRVFQSYQFIPLAILAAVGVDALIKKMTISPKVSITITGAILVSVFVYAVSPARITFADALKKPDQYYYNVYLGNDTLRAFDALSNQTPPESVVLAGEMVSQMIAAFTHNRTVIGREDAALSYPERIADVYAFIDGKMPAKEMDTFFTTYHISYILYGIDTAPFAYHASRELPNLEEIFRDGAVSIAQVRSPEK